jgi:hypothetical protein
MGQYPYIMKPGVQPEGAVFIEPLINPDMEVSLDINLGNPTNEFGVLLRANVPDVIPGAKRTEEIVDQLKINSFYFAVASADRVELQRLDSGKPTRLKSISVPPKLVFRLTVSAFGDKITVSRDGQELFYVIDSTLTGKNAGIVGLKAEGEPVRFDNFVARGYGGQFMTRAWAASMYKWVGPNVHYNPLYFEQRTLERHGQHWGNIAQPFVSHGLFVVDFFFWPASIGTTRPYEVFSADFYARPGDIIPFQLTPPAFNYKGIAFQLAVAGLVAAGVP